MIQSRRALNCQQRKTKIMKQLFLLPRNRSNKRKCRCRNTKDDYVSKQDILSMLPAIKSWLAATENNFRIYESLVQPVLSYGCKAFTSFLIGPNIFLSTLFSNNISHCSSHLHKTGKIIVFCIFKLCILSLEMGRQNSLDGMVTGHACTVFVLGIFLC